MILHLCSALVRHVFCVQDKKDADILEESSKVQWRGWSIWHTQRGWKSCLVWSREGSGGSRPCVQIHEGMMWRVRLFLATCIEGARDKLKDRIFNSKTRKKPFLLECGQTKWEPIAQKGCRGSSSLEIHKAWPDTSRSNLLLLICYFHVQRYGNTMK